MKRTVVLVACVAAVALVVAGALTARDHLAVHYLDQLRHELAATFAWHAVQTNLGAWPWQALIAFGVAAVFYPPVRAWVGREWDHVHAKLDHNAQLLRHLVAVHPDIDNAVLTQHPLPAPGRPTKGVTQL